MDNKTRTIQALRSALPVFMVALVFGTVGLWRASHGLSLLCGAGALAAFVGSSTRP